MKFIFSLILGLILPLISCYAQDNSARNKFLFNDSDIIIEAEDIDNNNSDKLSDSELEKAADQATNSAKELLNQGPKKFKPQKFSKLKKQKDRQYFSSSSTRIDPKHNIMAPFGLLWQSSIAETKHQGIRLNPVDMKDYTNAFIATGLPKSINFFEKIYVVYGNFDKLYRILAYSNAIEDDASASKVLGHYKRFSELLEKKYGNKEEFFTPAIIQKTIKDNNGKDKIIEEKAPIGNPEFLSQLMSSQATLYSTYYDKNVAVALSISIDSDKKSFIVIDYKNLNILEQMEAKTLDAL